MTPGARRAYSRFASFFLAIGSVFLMLGLARATFMPDVLRGNPVPVALLLLAIGGGLRWTVRGGEDDDGVDDDGVDEDGEDDDGVDAADLDADDEAGDATIDEDEARGPSGGPRVS